jgi:excisionase family DNA binding protein
MSIPSARRTGEDLNEPITVTVATAKQLSGLGNTTIWALIRDGKLKVVRVGRRTLVVLNSLKAVLTPERDD